MSQALDKFSHEVQQRSLTYFSNTHESNNIISLFGQYFMALDWDYDQERLYGFESFTEKDKYIDVLTSLPDNMKILMYNARRKKMYYLTR